MDIFVYDQAFEYVGPVDIWTSFIWTERRLGYGDFELYIPLEKADLNILVPNNYVLKRDSDVVMIIESIEIESDYENGSFVTVSGRSLESILDRRVIWGQTILDSDFQNGVKKLLQKNIIEPEIESRAIENFQYRDIIGNETFSQSLEVQFFGENLYDSIVELCAAYGCYFRIRLDSDNNFIFSLEEGSDRSYAQNILPYVVFSPSYETLSGSNFLESYSAFKNAALVAGEGEGSERMLVDAMASLITESIRLTRFQKNINSDGRWVTVTDTSYSIAMPCIPGETYSLYWDKTDRATVGNVFKYGFAQNTTDDQDLWNWWSGTPQGASQKTAKAPEDHPFLIIQVQGDNDLAMVYSRLLHLHVSTKSYTGLARREGFVDASSLSKTYEDDQGQTVEIPDATYRTELLQTGESSLADTAITSSFEGNLETNGMFKYGIDYYVGDRVQVQNEYGLSAVCIVSEVVLSSDAEGDKTVVTFEKYE